MRANDGKWSDRQDCGLKVFARRLAAYMIGCFAILAVQVQAEEIEDDPEQRLSLPFGFYNETFGLTGGWVEGRVGYPQPGARLFGTVMAGAEGSLLGFAMAQNLRLPGLERLFIDPMLSIGMFDNADTFIDGNPAFVGQRAGTNDSDENNFVSGDVSDNFARVRFRYLLPIGHGRDQIMPDYKMIDGELYSGASGGESLNPFESGRSFIEFRPFWRSLDVAGDGFDRDIRWVGARFSETDLSAISG